MYSRPRRVRGPRHGVLVQRQPLAIDAACVGDGVDHLSSETAGWRPARRRTSRHPCSARGGQAGRRGGPARARRSEQLLSGSNGAPPFAASASRSARSSKALRRVNDTETFPSRRSAQSARRRALQLPRRWFDGLGRPLDLAEHGDEETAGVVLVRQMRMHRSRASSRRSRTRGTSWRVLFSSARRRCRGCRTCPRLPSGARRHALSSGSSSRRPAARAPSQSLSIAATTASSSMGLNARRVHETTADLSSAAPARSSAAVRSPLCYRRSTWARCPAPCAWCRRQSTARP